MTTNNTLINIRKAYFALTGKHVDVFLTYKGTELGVSKPWLARCDVYEAASTSDEEAVSTLFKMLLDELAKKASSAEQQAKQFRQALSSLSN